MPKYLNANYRFSNILNTSVYTSEKLTIQIYKDNYQSNKVNHSSLISFGSQFIFRFLHFP